MNIISVLNSERLTGLLYPQKPKPQMLREPLGSPVEVGEAEAEGEGEKAEGEVEEEVEVEREEAAEMTLTGTVVCKRSVVGGARECYLCSR